MNCKPSAHKVLFINDTPRNGGPGRSLLTLLRRMSGEEIHRAVLLPRPGPIADLLCTSSASDEMFFEPLWVENIMAPWSRAMEREDFFATLPLKAIRSAGNIVRMTRAALRVAKLVKHQRFDLIYCNGTTADFMGALVGWWTGVPVLWHVRYTSIPGPLRALHRFLSQGSSVRKIVCVSEAAAALFPHCRQKVTVVHNGVELDDFAPQEIEGRLRQELSLPVETVVFGSHGRILRRKGYREMLQAAHIALGTLTAQERARCHFAIVGDTPADFAENHLDECRAFAHELCINECVSFLGFKADVRPYVNDFDVAVVPSVYADPLPRAVIESMALGKPVIAFDVGGVAEMLTAAEGTLVCGVPPDVDAMAAQFVRYFRDPKLRAQQGLAARARVLQEFDARAHAKKVMAVIADALNPPAQVAPAPVVV